MDNESVLLLYRLLFAAIRVGLVVVRIEPEGPDTSPRVVDVNPAALKISRQISDHFGNRTLDHYFPGVFQGKFAQTCSRIAGSGGSEEVGEVEIGANSYRIQLFSLLNGYLGIVFTDNTERKQADAEIAQLLAKVQKDAETLEKRVAERTAQLEEINSELDSFAYSVSHDLRAPLRSMRGFAEILLEDQSLLKAERTLYLNRILAGAQGMERMIQELLAYSRLSRQEIMLQRVSLATVVRDAVQQLELASGGKSYSVDVSGDLPKVIGHHAVLVQVMLNLLTNAIKFVPKGVVPKLHIWAEQGAQGEKAGQGEQGELRCRLFVEDNGIGIAPQHQERIFKIFERLHDMETYPGTGLGLAIVRKAVTRLGGRIGVESREGEGSRFWIELRSAGD